MFRYNNPRPSQTSCEGVHFFISDVGSLGLIKSQLPETVSYGEIKLAIAVLVVCSGFVRPRKQNAAASYKVNSTVSQFQTTLSVYRN